jgi:enediyne biosynthesis protein E4
VRSDTPILLTLSLLLAWGCGRDRALHPAETKTSAAANAEWFSDRAEESGLHFTHFNGMSGDLTMAEILGPGVALVDYDNDGDLDIYVAQGQMLGAGKTLSQALFPPRMPLPLMGRLYRNDLVVHPDGTRTLHFTDVTERSGIVATGYGMGIATGDFDNDGFVDLYLTNFGTNQLFHNNGDGTFTDVSKKSGTDISGWSVSAAFLDYDRDGWLDLYVGSYLRYSVETATKCFSPAGTLDYCTPNTYKPLPGRLFHNNRDGTFTDVTAKAGIASEFGPALGVTTADFNGDGWIDLYVANDSQPNQLWINQHDGTFRNTALRSGVALTQEGKAEASMGVDAGDFDNDGDEDLFITEQTGEGHNLYVNDGSGVFEDQSSRSGLAAASLSYTGFGTAWFDYDNDGWLDLLTVNGAVQTIQALAQARDPFPLHQRKQLFRNLRNGRFEDVTASAGAAFQLSEVGRGAAFGDIDNDGDTDVVVANNNGPLRLLINNVGNRRHWLGLRLVDHSAKRDMLGARVEIVRNREPVRLWRRARSDGSYASANDPRVLVGLGDSTETPTVRVRWPDGRLEEWANVPIDRYVTLAERGGP